MQNRHLMSQTRRMRHFARIANCRVRLAWFNKRLLCVIQAGGGGMKKNFTYMKYSPEKMHTAENRGGKYTQGKQTNTPKMKHAPVNSRIRTRFQSLPSGDRFWCSKTPLTCGRKANTENTKISRYV